MCLPQPLWRPPPEPLQGADVGHVQPYGACTRSCKGPFSMEPPSLHHIRQRYVHLSLHGKPHHTLIYKEVCAACLLKLVA